MFSIKDVAEYYNTTQMHYESWWNLKNTLSLHYGIWDNGVKNFSESLINTNKVLMNIANISDGEKVLDAGCGVGGAAFFLNSKKDIEMVGISLSNKQVDMANSLAQQKKLTNKISFKVMDFTNTTFDDASFDVIWACESICCAPDKVDFIKESYRLLKKNGRLILSDFFLTNKDQKDKHEWIKKWGDTWSVSNFIDSDSFEKNLKSEGFKTITSYDFTNEIKKSAKRLYYASLLGAIPSELYNLFHPKVSRFAKSHYKCGYYQYKALKANLWKYHVKLAIK